jgi:hypothetical protein
MAAAGGGQHTGDDTCHDDDRHVEGRDARAVESDEADSPDRTEDERVSVAA